MWSWSLLLRLLLAVALVFNGAASVAAIHAGHMTASAKATGPAPAAEAEMACHEHHQTGNTSQSPVPDDQSPDCLESGACCCACVHSTPLAIIELDVIGPVVGHAENLRPMALGHANAALPHLIRPPIG